MEKLNLKLLSKEATKCFKNALKLVHKDAELYPNIAGVYFAYDETNNVKYIIGSNGKVAVSYITDFPDIFNEKVLDKEGNIISTTYPPFIVPKELNNTYNISANEINNLYNQATQEVKALNLTIKKLKKNNQRIGIPITEDGLFEVDYFSFKEFLKLVNLVGNGKLYYDKGNIGLLCSDDKKVTGLVVNELYSKNENINTNIEDNS